MVICVTSRLYWVTMEYKHIIANGVWTNPFHLIGFQYTHPLHIAILDRIQLWYILTEKWWCLWNPWIQENLWWRIFCASDVNYSTWVKSLMLNLYNHIVSRIYIKWKVMTVQACVSWLRVDFVTFLGEDQVCEHVWRDFSWQIILNQIKCNSDDPDLWGFFLLLNRNCTKKNNYKMK